MFHEKIKLKGVPTFTLYDEFGTIKNQFTKDNLIVDVGNNWIVSRLASNSSNVMSHIAVGSSAAAAGSTNIALGTEISRVAVLVAGGTVLGSTLTFNATFGPGVATGVIAEAGVFNAASAGTMLSRVSFSSFTKAAADTLVIEWVYSQV